MIVIPGKNGHKVQWSALLKLKIKIIQGYEYGATIRRITSELVEVCGREVLYLVLTHVITFSRLDVRLFLNKNTSGQH
jgi:hypothetical protein